MSTIVRWWTDTREEKIAKEGDKYYHLTKKGKKYAKKEYPRHKVTELYNRMCNRKTKGCFQIVDTPELKRLLNYKPNKKNGRKQNVS